MKTSLRHLRLKVFIGPLFIALCALGSGLASEHPDGPDLGTGSTTNSVTDLGSDPGDSRLVFGSSVPFTTEDFLHALDQEIRAEKIKDERLNSIYWDKKHHRLWASSDNGTNVTWGQAIKHCEELELGDFSDWRLPSIGELEDLHDPNSTQTFKVSKEIRLSACCQWSSTKHTSTSAWNFSFRFRKRFSGTLTYSLDLRALCVRGPIDDLPLDWPHHPK